MIRSILVIPAVCAPVAALGVTAYLYNHPLSTSRTATIKSYDCLSPSCASSKALRFHVNPKSHMAVTDSYSIRLSKTDLRGRSDEEILASFTRGFFGGWVFTPERSLFACLRLFGIKFIPIHFSSE